jgi:ketosteroid isomerase-like protein
VLQIPRTHFFASAVYNLLGENLETRMIYLQLRGAQGGFRRNRGARITLAIVACIAALLALASPAAAQKDKKNKKNAEAPNNGQPIIPMGDEQQIDYMISGMLGAWQLGDVERLHQAYADDVTIVNGIWAPPVIGWANYSTLYQQQRARMQRVRLDRSNTYIKLASSGTVAWACYQWDFSADVDGAPTSARGQTTLVLEKRNGKWLIVHNHTSFVQMPQQGAPAPINPANTPSDAPPSSKPASR